MLGAGRHDDDGERRAAEQLHAPGREATPSQGAQVTGVPAALARAWSRKLARWKIGRSKVAFISHHSAAAASTPATNAPITIGQALRTGFDGDWGCRRWRRQGRQEDGLAALVV